MRALIVCTMILLAGCTAPAEPTETADAAPEGQGEDQGGTCLVDGRPCDAPSASTDFEANAAKPFEWTIRFHGGTLRIDIDIDETSAFTGFAVDGAGDCDGTPQLLWTQVGGVDWQVDCGDVPAGDVTLRLEPNGLAAGTLTVRGASA